MAEEQPEQSAEAVSRLISAALMATLVAYFARPLLGPVGTDITAADIEGSASLPIFAWCLGWPVALARSPLAAVCRFNWAFGCALMSVHIAVAFHLGHGWSHRAAWEHTREVGGYGDGVFVNYAFALVWAGDAIWAWVAFDSYCRRPRWLHWGVHGFLAFVVFNAAVVFGSSESRRVFTVAFPISLLFLLLPWEKLTRPVDASHSD